MSFTDALRDKIEIEPRETRQSFMLRYAGMRPIGANMTLARWNHDVAMASSLGNPQHEQDMLWSGTLYHMHEAMSAAVKYVSGTAPISAEDVTMALVMALVGHQENLRATRLNAKELAAGISDIHPEELAPLILQDMEKAATLYDKQLGASRQRE